MSACLASSNENIKLLALSILGYANNSLLYSQYFCCLFASVAEVKIQRRKKSPCLDTIGFRNFSSPENEHDSLLCQSVFFFSLEMSVHVVLVRKALVGMTQLLKTKVCPVVQEVPDSGSISRRTSWGSASFSSHFWLEGVQTHLTFLQEESLGIYLLFWMIGEGMCAVSWWCSNLLHPGRWRSHHTWRFLRKR